MIAGKHRTALVRTTLGLTLLLTACSKLPKTPLKTATAKPEPTQPSAIKVDVKTGGPVVLTTTVAEFQVTPDGYVQASLLKDGQKLSLDEPNVGLPRTAILCVWEAGMCISRSTSSRHRCAERSGRWESGSGWRFRRGRLGRRGRDLQRVLALEVYDKYPNILLSTVEYKNTGATEVAIDKSVNQRRRLNARLGDAKARPWEMWSFHGASYDWGKDDVVKLTPTFPNQTRLERWSKAAMAVGFRW